MICSAQKEAFPKALRIVISVWDDLEMVLDIFRFYFFCELKSSIKAQIKQEKQN